MKLSKNRISASNGGDGNLHAYDSDAVTDKPAVKLHVCVFFKYEITMTPASKSKLSRVTYSGAAVQGTY